MNTTKEIKEILDNPVIINILSFIDGKKSILLISKELKLTYKTIFYKIKKLESKGIVVFKGKKPQIGEKYEEKILMKIVDLDLHKKNLEEALKNPERKKKVLEGLNNLKKERGISRINFLNKINLNSSTEDTFTLIALEKLGIIRNRVESTKKGSQFLKDNSKT